jgi:hypothetical protein
MGEALNLEEVRIGYQIEHALSYENSGDPIEIARDALRRFRPRCHDIAAVLGDDAVPVDRP